jgi:hypothetical protein
MTTTVQTRIAELARVSCFFQTPAAKHEGQYRAKYVTIKNSTIFVIGESHRQHGIRAWTPQMRKNRERVCRISCRRNPKITRTQEVHGFDY